MLPVPGKEDAAGAQEPLRLSGWCPVGGLRVWINALTPTPRGKDIELREALGLLGCRVQEAC